MSQGYNVLNWKQENSRGLEKEGVWGEWEAKLLEGVLRGDGEGVGGGGVA